MILSDGEIYEAVQHGLIGIDPFQPGMVKPASYDLTLGEVAGGWIVPARGFVLASTCERIALSAGISAQLGGCSTEARRKLMVHCQAGFIDPGFSGQITYELCNMGDDPIELAPGMRLGQLVFMRLGRPARRPYGSDGLRSRYQHQRGPTPARDVVR